MFCDSCDDIYCEPCAKIKGGELEELQRGKKTHQRLTCHQCLSEKPFIRRSKKEVAEDTCSKCSKPASVKAPLIKCQSCKQVFHTAKCFNKNFRQRRQILCLKCDSNVDEPVIQSFLSSNEKPLGSEVQAKKNTKAPKLVVPVPTDDKALSKEL